MHAILNVIESLQWPFLVATLLGIMGSVMFAIMAKIEENAGRGEATILRNVVTGCLIIMSVNIFFFNANSFILNSPIRFFTSTKSFFVIG